MVYSLVAGAATWLLAVLAGGPLVAFLRVKKLGKAISLDGPASHLGKAGTPTMGGLLIFGSAAAVTAATAALRFHRPSIALPLAVMAIAGGMGFLDDLQTLIGREKREAHSRVDMLLKLGVLLGIAVGAALVLYLAMDRSEALVPHFGSYDIGPAYVIVAAAVIVATTSAVSITDGLDGLAAGTTALAFVAYGVIAGLQDQPYVTAFCFAVAGAGLGFLWYNAYPARVIMGDTGALALGVGLAVAALMTGWWLLLLVIGLVFVAEAASDVLQIGWFRLTKGRRLFRMAPLHHHFELGGWQETQVVIRFWAVSAVTALLGVALALA